MKEKALIAAIAAAALLAAACGCTGDPTKGYTLASQYRKGINTVAVDIFTRSQSVYRRDLEMRLTEAVVKRLELDTPYKVVPKDRADTLLTGMVQTISQRTMSFEPTSGRAREMEMIVTVSVTWRDLRSGDVIFENRRVKTAGVYIPLAPLSEDFFQGSEEAINRLAKRVVEKMEAPW